MFIQKFLILVASLTVAITCRGEMATMDVLGEVEELRPGLLEGYLHGQPVLNSKVFIPAPPSAGSALELADVAASEAALALQNSPRWDLAARDAELKFPEAAATFQCAVGRVISDVETPVLNRLLQRSLADFGLASYPAKQAYQRSRPFVTNEQPICTPHEREMLAGDGSYPSGHSAIGWGWALVLSQVFPEKAESILARGREYTYSRMVCNVHWQSDTLAGMTVGAAVFARLQNDPLYLATMAAAKAEAEKISPINPDDKACAAEANAIAFENS
ncbi:acid phosphatase [Luminiphilus sp. nBUS_16]|uniref:acid phosphatase n=1 Tax=Luminiphilus sp. nBUS_16 TaxID=3395315 RepID=UPI003EBE9103